MPSSSVLLVYLKKEYPNALFVGGGHHLDAEAVNILTYTDVFYT